MNASTTLRETISHNSLSYLVYQDHIDVSLSRSNPQYSRMAAMGLKLRDKIAEKITELRTFSSCDASPPAPFSFSIPPPSRSRRAFS